MAQEDWRDGTITTLFKAKSNFRRERRNCRSVYSGRASFADIKKLNAVTVNDVWGSLSESGNFIGLTLSAGST